MVPFMAHRPNAVHLWDVSLLPSPPFTVCTYQTGVYRDCHTVIVTVAICTLAKNINKQNTTTADKSIWSSNNYFFFH